jgi:hypothetical protein
LQYWGLLDQLREAFDPDRLAAAVAAEQQQQQQQLRQQQHSRLMYTYVQAAVRLERLDRVVGALESLVAAACTFGIAVALGQLGDRCVYKHLCIYTCRMC